MSSTISLLFINGDDIIPVGLVKYNVNQLDLGPVVSGPKLSCRHTINPHLRFMQSGLGSVTQAGRVCLNLTVSDMGSLTWPPHST